MRSWFTTCALFIGFSWVQFIDAGTPVNTIAFHPSQTFAAWNGDQSIIVQNTQTNARIKPITVPMARVRDIAFDPQGQWLAVAGGSPGEHGNLIIVDWKDRSIQRHLEYEGEWLTSVCFSADGGHLAIGSGNSDILIYQFDSPTPKLNHITTLSGHAGSVMDTVFDSTGHWLVSTGSDRSVKIWNLEQRSLHRTFAHHTGIVFSASLRPASSGQESLPFYLATASADQTVRVWQPEIGRMVRIVRNHHTDLFSVAYHPSGKWIASGGKDGIIRNIDAQSYQILGSKKVHEDWIYALAFSPDGKLMASGDWAGKVLFHQVNEEGTE